LVREPWIKCKDLPLSIFESAGGLFRASSMDGRAGQSNFNMNETTKQPRNSSQAESFNKGITKIHI
jgi:hypothetical protein